ncbi:TolC family outer membrane protein [Tardiphaga sp. 804_B3_N1_9]|uniref:TolC family outer membrane protein n=1 Tax=Tardiphaga TaxID=1395974 RepID=UPI0015864B3C|nr:TolC family outer membrane protein [Tardiphaga robiniae]
MVRHGIFGLAARRALRTGMALSLIGYGIFAAVDARAETVWEALAKAYQSNPQLNGERARQRATDENVPQAMAGYRPQVAATLSYGLQAVRNLLVDNTIQGATLKPWTIGVTVTQTLYNGNKTANSVRVAELQVQSGREALRNVGQGVLLDAVVAYTNVLANQSLVEAQRTNVTSLRETLGIAQKRLNAGDVTPTDTSQAEARLARGQADLNAAEVNLAISQATYTQVIGAAPSRLSPAEPMDRLLPRNRDDAVNQAFKAHPAVLAAGYDVDVATTTIKVAESSLLPTLTLQGSASKSSQSDPTLGTFGTDQASIVGQLTAPIYDGGLGAAQTRQAKELSSVSRLVLEQVRNQARTAVVGAWVSNEGAKTAVSAAEAEVRAAGVALQGVQREAQGGQRTTVDVLNSQQDLVQAKARLIGAQRDRVIASYSLLSAIGRLDVKTLGLNTPDYLPEVHYHQVRDAWHGLRTPSGQ